MNFDKLAQAARERGPRNLVVIGAHEENVLKAVSRAARDGIARPVLLGDQAEVERISAQEKLDLTDCSIENIPDPREAASAALTLVRQGEAGALMKGKITTPELMRAALKQGLRREGRLLTHLAGFEHPRLGERLLLASDTGLLPFPTLEQRVQIIINAVEAARSLGVDQPKVAVVAATENVDEKIPYSVEAARLKEMNQPGGELEGYGIVDGPLDLFAALDPEAAAIKGIGGEVAGRADILHVPDVIGGNLMGKAMVFFSEKVRIGGCVIGGVAPIILLSRASSADDKYCSILLGLSCAPVS